MVSTSAGRTSAAPEAPVQRKQLSCHRLRCRAGDGGVESGAPVGEAALLGGEIVAFVGDVVDQAHESVERGESVALGRREADKNA